jgi:hypothetical protein
MSKVEELAKKYCEGSSFEDACMERPAYIAGYHQAEKDLKLTWEDIVMIDKLLIDLGMIFPAKSTPDYYQEVLNRFNKLKGK